MASRVYWADLRTDYRENLPQKLTRLMKTAGMGQIDFEGKFTAIKLHFGEPGNLAFLRPNWAKTVADFVKERGGKPFLTDCNTLYVGGRKNALDHMDAAMLNGFSPLSTGCQIIIADGLKGNDEVEVPVRGGEYVEHRHGLRQPGRKNGAAQRRQAPCGPGALRGLRRLHPHLRPQRPYRHRPQGQH